MINYIALVLIAVLGVFVSILIQRVGLKNVIIDSLTSEVRKLEDDLNQVQPEAAQEGA